MERQSSRSASVQPAETNTQSGPGDTLGGSGDAVVPGSAQSGADDGLPENSVDHDEARTESDRKSSVQTKDQSDPQGKVLVQTKSWSEGWDEPDPQSVDVRDSGEGSGRGKVPRQSSGDKSGYKPRTVRSSTHTPPPPGLHSPSKPTRPGPAHPQNPPIDPNSRPGPAHPHTPPSTRTDAPARPARPARPRSGGDTPSQVPTLPAIDPTGQMTRQSSWSVDGSATLTPKPPKARRNNLVSSANSRSDTSASFT